MAPRGRSARCGDGGLGRIGRWGGWGGGKQRTRPAGEGRIFDPCRASSPFEAVRSGFLLLLAEYPIRREGGLGGSVTIWNHLIKCNGSLGRSRVIKASLHGSLGRSRVIKASLHGSLGRSRVIKASLHGSLGRSRVIKASLHGSLGRSRVIKASPRGSLGRSRVSTLPMSCSAPRTCAGSSSEHRWSASLGVSAASRSAACRSIPLSPPPSPPARRIGRAAAGGAEGVRAASLRYVAGPRWGPPPAASTQSGERAGDPPGLAPAPLFLLLRSGQRFL
jgi:hypothetical protein